MHGPRRSFRKTCLISKPIFRIGNEDDTNCLLMKIKMMRKTYYHHFCLCTPRCFNSNMKKLEIRKVNRLTNDLVRCVPHLICWYPITYGKKNHLQID